MLSDHSLTADSIRVASIERPREATRKALARAIRRVRPPRAPGRAAQAAAHVAEHGGSLQQAAELFGVTRQAVSYHRKHVAS